MKITTILWSGLIGFALLALLAVLLAGRWIEDDLRKNSLDDLQAKGQGWADVEMDGRDATVIGSSPDAESAEKALQVVADLWGIRSVTDQTEKP